MTTVSDLIAKLSAATGPSRELDAEIAVVVNGGEIVWKQTRYTMEQHPARRYASAQHIGGYGFDHVPEYTASLDAALTLVPDEYDWVIGKTNSGLTVYAKVGPNIEEFADTPALALCIAALKAREGA